MKIAGIVAEYNPFHSGHAYQIDRTRSEDGGGATHIAAVMSGSFVQRGEPALLPKSDRVRAALAGGVDLVLELPLPWALSSAEHFAFGAVSLLDALGCVGILSFGSECGDLDALTRVADTLDSPRFSSLLRYHLDMGIAFPEARQRAVREIAGEKTAALLESPNNTLGIEYIKALRALRSPMIPYTVARFGAGHADVDRPLGNIASATYLRTLLRADRLLEALPYIPAGPARFLSDATQAGRAPSKEERLDRAVLARLRMLTPEDAARLPDLSEGIENRLLAAVREAASLPGLMETIKTRRYPMTRVRRLVWSAFLGVPAGLSAARPPYIRVLGANQKGLEILAASKKAALPLISRASQAARLPGDGAAVWTLECRATDLFALSLPVPPPCGQDCTEGFIRPE